MSKALVVLVLLGILLFTGCASNAPNGQPTANNSATQTPSQTIQQPSLKQTYACPDGTVVTNLSNCPKPKPLLKLQDITVSQNDNRGALLEISSTELNDKASAPVLVGMMKGDSYTLNDGAAITLSETAMGYTLSANWVKMSVGSEIYYINKGESNTHGKERIKFVETTLDQSLLYATIRSGTLSKNLSKGESFTVNGKGITLRNIYVGNALSVIIVELVSDGKAYYVPIHDEAQVNSDDIYFDSFGFNSNLAALSQKDKKVFFDVYGSDGRLNETVKMTVGETRQIKNNQVQYLAYSEGCMDDYTLQCKTASLDISGKKSTMKVGDVVVFGDGYLKIADFEVVGDGAYASLMLFEKDGNTYLLKKLGDSLTMPNDETAILTDIRRGMVLGKKEIKLTIGGRDKVLGVGEFLCSSYEIATDESSCYNSNFKGKEIVITQEAMAKTKIVEKKDTAESMEFASVSKDIVNNLKSSSYVKSKMPTLQQDINQLKTAGYDTQAEQYVYDLIDTMAVSYDFFIAVASDMNSANKSYYNGDYASANATFNNVIQNADVMLTRWQKIDAYSNSITDEVKSIYGYNRPDTSEAKAGIQTIKTSTQKMIMMLAKPPEKSISCTGFNDNDCRMLNIGETVIMGDITFTLSNPRFEVCRSDYSTDKTAYLVFRVKAENTGDTKGYISSMEFHAVDSYSQQYDGSILPYPIAFGGNCADAKNSAFSGGNLMPGAKMTGDIWIKVSEDGTHRSGIWRIARENSMAFNGDYVIYAVQLS